VFIYEKHDFNVNWRDEQKYVVAIYLVKKISVDTLMKKLHDNTIIENKDLLKIVDKKEISGQ